MNQLPASRFTSAVAAFRKSLMITGLFMALIAPPIDPGVSMVAPTKGAEQEVREKMASDWRRRAENVRSARFVWVEDVFVPSGAVARRNDASHDGKPQGVPADKRYLARGTAILADGRLRFEYERKSTGDAESETDAWISAFDGVEYRQINEPKSPSRHHQGLLHNGLNPDIHNMSLKPFLWAFRLVDERLRTFDLESFVLQDQAGTIDGRPCLILERKLTNADVEAVWVDPAREHCVARYSYTNGHSGVVTRQVDVSYQEAPEVGWIPSKWTRAAQANDGVLNMTTATVERYEINPVTQLSDFQPEFPRECLVVDGRGPHELFYLVAADGSRRDILPQELFAPLTYDDLANSKTGEALRKDGQMFWVYGVATALALGVAFLLLRRARTRLST